MLQPWLSTLVSFISPTFYCMTIPLRLCLQSCCMILEDVSLKASEERTPLPGFDYLLSGVLARRD